VIIPIFTGYALYNFVKNRKSDWIRHRQPCAYFLCILGTGSSGILSSITMYWAVKGRLSDLSWDNVIRARFVCQIIIFLYLMLYVHRIWMCIYNSLLQKFLGDLNIWSTLDAQTIDKLRSSKELSNFWVNLRHTLGNSNFMSVAWSIIWIIASGVELWQCRKSVLYDWGHAYNDVSLVNGTIFEGITGFAFVICAVQNYVTFSDNFSIRTELNVTCLVLASYVIYTEILPRTTLASQDLFAIEAISETGWLLLQILIINTHLYICSKRDCGKCSGYTIDTRMVLKDELLFTAFEEQLKREYKVQNLNFLVSCAQYRRMLIRQGQFGIASSSEGSDYFEMLNWRDTSEEKDSNLIQTARTIYNEFCVKGAPQEIKLDDNTSKKLSVRMKNLSNIFNYTERDLFSEAVILIENQLDQESIPRLQRNLRRTCGLFKINIRGRQEYRVPILSSSSVQ